MAEIEREFEKARETGRHTPISYVKIKHNLCGFVSYAYWSVSWKIFLKSPSGRLLRPCDKPQLDHQVTVNVGVEKIFWGFSADRLPI
ncbi:MAG: hypothetical protein HFG75_04815 [Hungatella sp.]|nr:hypothetical protein [Hungatella sp.]